MDYRTLLIKYIAYIGEIEGVSYISGDNPENFTKEEWDELNKLDKESTGNDF